MWRSEVLAGTQFRRFYIGRSISWLGSSMTPVALAFAVLQTPHGESLLGYVLACQVVAHVLLALFGGTFADRYRKDRIIVIGNLGSFVTQTGIAVVVLTHAASGWLFPFALASGALSAISSPALRGLIPEIVEPQQIKVANSLLATSRNASRILGPPAAGVLVAAIGGGWAIAADGLTFALSAAFMAHLQMDVKTGRTRARIWTELREGWLYFRSQRWIWMITAAFTGMNLIQMGVWQVLGPIIALHTFGSAAWGLILGAKSVGLLAASAVLVRVFPRQPLRAGMIGIALSGIPMILLGGAAGVEPLAGAAFVAGAGSDLSQVTWDTTVHQLVPTDRISRVFAFDEVGSYIGIPIGEILAVPLAAHLGYGAVAISGGALFILLALLPLLEPTVWNSSR